MSQDIQVIHVKQSSRVESGAVRFVYEDGHDDWRALVLRGDDAAFLGFAIKQLGDIIKESGVKDTQLLMMTLNGIKRTIFDNVIEGHGPWDEETTR